MVNRLLKRFKREHRKKKPSSGWVFHHEQWGDLTVSVMPRSVSGSVFDSNTGVVVKAPHHRAILGGVVVNDGRMPNCDDRALNEIICGNEKESWKLKTHPWTIPTYIVQDSEINDAWRSAIEDIAKAIGRERAEVQLESVLGWCTDSISCSSCGLTIPGHWVPHVIEQARNFGWGLDSNSKPICPAHEIILPFPSDEEIAVMESRDQKPSQTEPG